MDGSVLMAINLTNYSIDLPFKFTSGKTVKLARVSDPAFWRNKVLSTVQTTNGERIWYPIFGASLASTVLFENNNVATDVAYAAVSEAFVRWLPDLKFISLDSSYDSNSGTLSLTIKYILPNGDDDYVKISLGTTSPSGESASVIWNG
jgi:phage baseplate assembly protein W